MLTLLVSGESKNLQQELLPFYWVDFFLHFIKRPFTVFHKSYKVSHYRKHFSQVDGKCMGVNLIKIDFYKDSNINKAFCIFLQYFKTQYLYFALFSFNVVFFFCIEKGIIYLFSRRKLHCTEAMQDFVQHLLNLQHLVLCKIIEKMMVA